MTGEMLLAEGQRLARPCVHLCPEGDPATLAAVWRGEGLVAAAGEGYEHWLTVDCRHFPEGISPSSGCLSIYTQSGTRDGSAVHDASQTLSLERGGLPLYAHPTSSLPPLEAVFLRGSPQVAEWLARIGWEADSGYNGNFPDPDAAHPYLDAQRASLPIDGQTVFAILGGWHVPWPEGDWRDLLESPLLVLTLAEAEPWVEVFNTTSGFLVIQRVS